MKSSVRILLLILCLRATALAQPATAPAPPEEKLHLHATAVSSGEVDLFWYDVYNETPRYLIERSADKGVVWKKVGVVPGGSATARYDDKDVNVTADTNYLYRVVTPGGAVLSDVADVHVRPKNLVEVLRGETTVTIDDVLKWRFWNSTLFAVFWLLAGFIPRLLVAILIYLIFYVLYRVARHVTLGSMRRAKVDEGIHEILVGLLRWSILGFAIVICCNQIGVEIAALLTGVSIIGLAIGFAAQDSLSNLIASVVVFLDKPFRIGDWVTVDGNYGRIQRITFRSTRILTTDGDVLVFPNIFVIGNKVVNHSLHTINWVNLPLTIPNTIPLAKARTALLATTAGDDRLLTDMPPKVTIQTVNADGSVAVFFSFCIKDEGQQGNVMSDYLEKAKSALDSLAAAKA
ncbi:MAG TPA: mechanosensitive ion channel domain-containing protein [Tepidisphaeraceae bacterium]|nr:mechanosensitive ion channel domain-containing protein [Tepidisphaeraceae bacterium]